MRSTPPPTASSPPSTPVGGRVTDTEIGDEDSYYEVGAALPDGTAVDVQLDGQFNVVDQQADREVDD